MHRRFPSSAPRFLSVTIAALMLALGSSARAVDYKVEELKEAPPAEDLAPEIASQLAATGVRVIRGSSTKFCDVWLVKEIEATVDFKPTGEVQYPFKPGQLIGVARYSRKGSDFRDQDIDSGLYTMRYALQPVDGAHVGTSPTRDFLLLIQAEKDQSPAILEYKPLTQRSAEAAGSSHPALLSLQKTPVLPPSFPAVRHDEDREWWILAVKAPVKGAEPIPLELVVVGVAAE